MMAPLLFAAAVGVGSAASDVIYSEGDESKTFGFSAGQLSKEGAIVALTTAHTDKSSSGNRIEVVFLLLGAQL